MAQYYCDQLMFTLELKPDTYQRPPCIEREKESTQIQPTLSTTVNQEPTTQSQSTATVSTPYNLANQTPRTGGFDTSGIFFISLFLFLASIHIIFIETQKQ